MYMLYQEVGAIQLYRKIVSDMIKEPYFCGSKNDFYSFENVIVTCWSDFLKMEELNSSRIVSVNVIVNIIVSRTTCNIRFWISWTAFPFSFLRQPINITAFVNL